MWTYGLFGKTINVNNASDLKEAIKLKHDFLIKDIERLNRILKRFDGEVLISEARSDKDFNNNDKVTKIYATYSYYTKTSDNIESLISDASKKLKMSHIILEGGKDPFPNIIGDQKKIMKRIYDEFRYYQYLRLFREDAVYYNESFKEFLYAYSLANDWI